MLSHQRCSWVGREVAGLCFASPVPSRSDPLLIRPDQGTLDEYTEFMRRDLDCAAVVVAIAQPFARLLEGDYRGEAPKARSHVWAIAPAVGGMAAGGKVLSDPARLADPIEAGQLGFGFYAGIPLRRSARCNLGTLAAVDVSQRKFSKDELVRLKMLATILVDMIGFRLTADLTPSLPPAGIRAGRLFCA